jgi:GDP-L-fucose synthase
MRICLTGGSGFLGQHVTIQLLDAGHDLDVCTGRDKFDLRNLNDCLLQISPRADAVVHLAYPGTKGIQTSLESAADLVHNQLLIDLNVIRAAAMRKVQKIICVGSVCEYPEIVNLPAGENQLWRGYPEAVNAPYGIAKRMQQGLLEAYRRQYGLLSTQLILGNMYGPGDTSGHVIPSLIRRACAAAKTGEPLLVWGDGTATREFLYVEDAARAVAQAVVCPPQLTPVNIVSGFEMPIKLLAQEIAIRCGSAAVQPVRWDSTKPNGQPRRWFCNQQAATVLDWKPQMSFFSGLTQTITWLREVEHL